MDRLASWGWERNIWRGGLNRRLNRRLRRRLEPRLKALAPFADLRRPKCGAEIKLTASDIDVQWIALGGMIDDGPIRTDELRLAQDVVGFHVTELDDRAQHQHGRVADRVAGMAADKLADSIIIRMYRLLLSAGSGDIRPLSEIGHLGATATVIGPSHNLKRVACHHTRQLTVPWFKDEAGGRIGTDVIVYEPSHFTVSVWKDLRTKEFSEDEGWYWHFQGRLTAGMVYLHPRSITRYSLDAAAVAP